MFCGRPSLMQQYSRAEWKEHLEELPPVKRDASFWGMTTTQFLGAFNDNLYKQLVLLYCTHVYRESPGGGDWLQSLAAACFTLPFVLLSGFAGFLSDRNPKRTVVIFSKMAEIVVMALGAVAFYTMSVPFMMLVLLLMGAQSAFFGPSKYGILSEMFRERDLPYINGVFVMTTFMAIVLGTWLAGQLLPEEFRQSQPVWVISAACVGIAVLGTITSLFVRWTPVANAELKLHWSTFMIDKQTWRLMRRDRMIRNVLYITSVFWMIGLAIQLAANAFGKYQLALTNARTSTMLVGVAVGIAIGCVIAGRWSQGKVNFFIYKTGNFGIVMSLTILGFLGMYGPNLEKIWAPSPQALAKASPEEKERMMKESEKKLLELGQRPMNAFEWTCRGLFLLTGISAGLFTVPLQTFLQVRPPDDEKGRVIAAMNFINWVGILLASGVYGIVSKVISLMQAPQATHFLVSALIMALLFLYRVDEKDDNLAAAV